MSSRRRSGLTRDGNRFEGGTEMTHVAERATTTLTYQLYVNASPETVWHAITTTEQAERYGYRGPVEVDLRPGGAYGALPTDEMKACGAPDVAVEGEVLAVEPARRLVQTWRMLFSPELAGEPHTILTWEIEPARFGGAKLTLSHNVEGAPQHAALVSGSVPDAGGGWPFVLSDLKTLLETGSALGG